ncbi:MAG: farnesyl diphosphate synthase [Pseudomonadota bacterium]
MDLKSYLNERRERVEGVLSRSIGDNDIPETLRRAMSYSLEAGGKRLRPILVIAGAEAVGGEESKVMRAAVAMEMIHTFSLIHDDLPAMDDDSLRRGKPTNHKVFGEAQAILAGDGLLAEAFYFLASDGSGLNSAALVETIRDIAAATGGRGMTGGQAVDVEATGRQVKEEDLTRLHLMKTGALITASVTAGARLSGASREEIESLERYGKAVGLAFQIADDVLDIEGDQTELGKDVGSDVSKGKSTYPAVIGLEASKRKAASLVDQAVAALARFDNRAEPLRLIARYIVERKN